MSLVQIQAVQSRIRNIVANLNAVPLSQNERLIVLGRYFFTGLTVTQFEDFADTDLLVVLNDFADFLESRVSGEVKIRISHGHERQDNRREYTFIKIINDDSPFLVDSLSEYFAQQRLRVHNFLHPVLTIKRDQEGHLLSIEDRGDNSSLGVVNESCMYIQIDRMDTQEQAQQVYDGVSRVLENVKQITSDWKEMCQALERTIENLGTAIVANQKSQWDEVMQFLQWLYSNHFTFLGYRYYDFDANNHVLTQDSSRNLGFYRDTDYYVLKIEDELVDSCPEMVELLFSPMPLTIIKTNRHSTVHRSEHMDQIIVTAYSAEGQVIGQHSFIGLFTSSAYSSDVQSIPLLRGKIDHLLDKAGCQRNSHDGKAIIHVLNDLPRDELFQVDNEALFNIVMGIVQLETRSLLRLFVRRDCFMRFVSVMVYLPSENLNTDIRRQIGDILSERYEGRVSAYSLWSGSGRHSRLHFIIATTPSAVRFVDLRSLESEVIGIARRWEDDLYQELHQTMPRDEADNVYDTVSPAYPQSYKSRYPVDVAVQDLISIRHMMARNQKVKITSNLQFVDGQDSRLYFRLYKMSSEPAHLSDCLPIFENIGLHVITEYAHQLTLCDGACLWLHEFSASVMSHYSCAMDMPSFASVQERLCEALEAVWCQEVENDPINLIALSSEVTARQLVVFRAIAKYLLQSGLNYSLANIAETLFLFPTMTYRLWTLFNNRFNPFLPIDKAGRQRLIDETIEQINNDLRENKSLRADQERILRRYLSFIQAVVRTNFFQHDRQGAPKPYLSFKIHAAALSFLANPRPLYEVWVYSLAVEGVHFRFGRVARGGLRWSDRREDFRAEILELVKTQKVKNSIIVPSGAKGGFFPRRIIGDVALDKAKREAEGRHAYSMFVRALLDLTDNIVDGNVVSPRDLICHDDVDPYLVVAADKGTAQYSDLANEVAAEYDFWLGDAFAAGGANGYDHKKMGITAKGAWVAVKQHFYEMGIDVQSAPVHVVGVGDMSGDVFGNGLLLSRSVCLVAAFNHKHIFIDPTPDPEVSWQERKRLFDMPGSQWSDYNPDLISQGGGVFARDSRSVRLSPQIATLLNLDLEYIPAADLIKALLRAPVDLLWFGGIGTYIKSSQQQHHKDWDKSSELVRVDAAQLQAKVIGEGANLAMSQLGRIEFSRQGGRLNTDAVDNSGGVDCSDHEVNIKILLNEQVRYQKISLEERNQLLVQMADEVAELVLQTNYEQSIVLTVSEWSSSKNLSHHQRFIDSLCKSDILDRTVEALPSNKEIKERAVRNQGLTRPELSVLMAYAKIDLYEKILESDLPDDPAVLHFLYQYMPKLLRERFAQEIPSHQLRREIIATVLSNRIVNLCGITFTHRLAEVLNIPITQVVRAFVLVHETFNAYELYQQIEEIKPLVDSHKQIGFYHILRRLLMQQVRWVLSSHTQFSDLKVLCQRYNAHYRQMFTSLVDCIDPTLRARFEEELQAEAGQYDETVNELHKRLLLLSSIGDVCGLLHLMDRTGIEFSSLAKVYHRVNSIFCLEEIRNSMVERTPASFYEQLSLAHILKRLDDLTLQLVERFVHTDNPIIDILGNEGEQNSDQMIFRVIRDFHQEGKMSIAMASVLISELGKI